MATRYNAFGWYNPYGPAQIPGGSSAGLVGGQQPLRGLIVPMTGGPAWATEPGLNNGFVEVKNEQKVHADPPGATSSTTTTVVTSGGTNGGTSGVTTTSENNKLTSDEKSKFRKLGMALCILSAFTLGVAVAYLATMNIPQNTTTKCPEFHPSSTTSSTELFYYWGVRAAAVPLPIFTLVIGILCMVIRERRDGQTQAMYGMTIFCLVLLVPLILVGCVGGILQATGCVKVVPIDAGIIYLVLPILLLLMALILTGLLMDILLKLAVAKKVSKAAKPKPTSTSTTTTTTTTTPATTTPAATIPPATIPAPPTQLPPAVPAQPLVPTQYVPQPPQQLNYVQPAYQPSYQPTYPSPYQQVPQRYGPARPPPMFGASPYGRPPTRSPYGYSPYSRPPRPYRPRPNYY